MITPEQRSRMRRLFFAEHWKIGTIAAELGVHLRRASRPRREARRGVSDEDGSADRGCRCRDLAKVASLDRVKP